MEEISILADLKLFVMYMYMYMYKSKGTLGRHLVGIWYPGLLLRFRATYIWSPNGFGLSEPNKRRPNLLLGTNR